MGTILKTNAEFDCKDKRFHYIQNELHFNTFHNKAKPCKFEKIKNWYFGKVIHGRYTFSPSHFMMRKESGRR